MLAHSAERRALVDERGLRHNRTHHGRHGTETSGCVGAVFVGSLDHRRAGFLLLSILACHRLAFARPFPQGMALIRAGLVLLAFFVFVLGQFCLGGWVLRKLRLEAEFFPEHFLVCVCSGVILTEIAIFLLQWTQHIRSGCFLVLFAVFVPAGFELPGLWRKAKAFVSGSPPFSWAERLVVWAIGVVLLTELLSSLAPLTGSDALHYHFTTEQLILNQGFHPIFFLTHSFLCGQGHLLILLGLALGSEALTMSFIFLGGALAALAVGCLAARWVPRIYATSFALLFLLTPLVFWQICSSGSPDIWMAAFTGAGVLVIARTREDATARHALLAGFLAGGVAGAKYTGCVIAAALAVAFLVEYRSARKGLLFFVAALFAGIWPLARNLMWTGDPFFPMLVTRLFPERVNPRALGDLLADTGAAGSHSLFQAIPFLFFSVRRAAALPGFWEFYGPIVLALVPLAMLAFRNTREWRVRIIVWLCAGVGIFLASGLTRFLLPILPIAYSCVAAGVYFAGQRGWKHIHGLATISVFFACLLGAGGLALYTAPELRASVGMNDRQSYLEEKAPEYQVSQAVNRTVSSIQAGGKTLVFIRHLYYLRVPYIEGDPATSWAVNPDVLKTAGDWRAFLHAEQIAFVVRAPSYPATIAAPLEELEREGYLIPYSKSEVQDFQGMRIAGIRVPVEVVILRVAPEVSGGLPEDR
jgi:hypothetical protein